jgi:AcrR family transcriptional regulator
MAEHSYHHGDLRRALLDAALGVLSEGQDLSLREVARRAGVSHAAPYHHFEDRRALLAALAEEGLDALRSSLHGAAASHSEDPRHALLGLAVAYVRFAVENPAVFRLIFSAELRDREGLPQLQEAYTDAYAALAQEVRRLLPPREEPAEVRFWTLWAWSLVHGLTSLMLDQQVGNVRTADDAEELARRVLRRSLPPELRAGAEGERSEVTRIPDPDPAG